MPFHAIAILIFFFGLPVTAFPAETTPELPKLKKIENFRLEDAFSGKTVSMKNLQGVVWVANLFFTHCQTICPMNLQKFSILQKKFANLPDFRLISVTTDPVNDDRKSVKSFVEKQNLSAKNWFFLTGTASALLELIQKEFLLSASPANPGLHSGKIVLVDGQGFIRGYFDGNDNEHWDRLLKAVPVLVSEKPASRKSASR